MCILMSFVHASDHLFICFMFFRAFVFYIDVIYMLHDIASVSDITPCNKIDKPLVVYRLLCGEAGKSLNGLVHSILVLSSHGQIPPLDAHVDVSCDSRGLILILLFIYIYILCI